MPRESKTPLSPAVERPVSGPPIDPFRARNMPGPADQSAAEAFARGARRPPSFEHAGEVPIDAFCRRP